MKLTGIKNTLLIIILLIVVLAGGIFFVFSLIKSKGLETSKLNSEFSFYEERREEVLKSGKDGERAEQYENAINSYFVGKNEAVSFIEMLEAEAKLKNIELAIRNIREESFGANAQESTKEYMVLQIETKSSWQNLSYFLSYLEHLPYVVTMRSVKIASFVEGVKAESRGWKGEIEFSVVKEK